MDTVNRVSAEHEPDLVASLCAGRRVLVLGAAGVNAPESLVGAAASVVAVPIEEARAQLERSLGDEFDAIVVFEDFAAADDPAAATAALRRQVEQGIPVIMAGTASDERLRELERTNRELWRTNRRLAREWLGRADSAAASALAPSPHTVPRGLAAVADTAERLVKGIAAVILNVLPYRFTVTVLGLRARRRESQPK